MSSDLKALKIMTGIVAAAVVGVVLKEAKSVIFPFFLALFIYFILVPVQDALMKLKLSQTFSLIIILIFTFVVLYLMGALFYSSGKAFASDLPAYEGKLRALIRSLQDSVRLAGAEWDPLAWAEKIDVGKAASFVLGSLGTFVSFLSTLGLVLVFLFFMLAGRGKLEEKIRRFSAPRRSSQMIEIIRNIDRQVQKYLALKTVISLASGLLAFFVIKAFGVRYAVLWAFITFILNYIPNIGSLFSKIFPFLFAWVQLGRFWPAAWMLVFLVITDAITSMIIEPRLMGSGLGLSPLFILFALFFWGWLWGIPGMVLAVPILVVMKIASANFPSMRWLEALISK